MTLQEVNELLCNGSRGNNVLQNFQNEDTTTTLIINNMNENESIKIKIVRLSPKNILCHV